MWKFKLAKSHSARVSTQTALETSAQSPDSGSQALDNSHASSAALAELVSSIGCAIDQVDYDEEAGDVLQLQLERLSNEVRRYQNSRVRPECGEQWTCGEELAKLLYAACVCSISVYDSSPEASIPGLKIDCVGYRSASLDGTRKCTALWTVDRASEGSEASKELIISIRGSASAVDHVVNLNGQERDMKSFFNFPTETQAHAGFLGCAHALLPSLSKDILRIITQDPDITHIVFTGHSAGGAVASLLFLHFIQSTPPHLSSIMFSLFTFGAAPVTSPNVTHLCKQQPNVGLMLSFINENDMVAKADAPYLRSLVDLYRASYSLPPSRASTTSSLTAPTQSTLSGVTSIWPLPRPTFQLLGDIILLDEVVTTDDEKLDRGIPLMRALSVSPDELSKLIFCDVEVHRRKAYMERLKAIWLGACRGPAKSKREAMVETLLKSGDPDIDLELAKEIAELYAT